MTTFFQHHLVLGSHSPHLVIGPPQMHLHGHMKIKFDLLFFDSILLSLKLVSVYTTCCSWFENILRQ